MKRLTGILILILMMVLSSCTMLSPASLEKAEKLRDSDKTEKAIEVYEELIEEDEENFDAWFGLTETYIETKSFLEAAETLNDLSEVVIDELDSDDDEFEDAFDDLYGYLEDLNEEEVEYDGEYDQIAALMTVYQEEVDDRLDISDIGFIYDYMTTIIGISLPTRSLEYWGQSGQGLSDQLESLGYIVNLEYANDDVEEQIEEIEAMIENQCDVLVIAPIDGHALNDVLEKAKDEHITVIAYDRMIFDTEFVDYMVAADDYQTGVLQGEYIIDMMNQIEADGPFHMELFAGPEDSEKSTMFFDGAMEALESYIQSGQLIVSSDEVAIEDVATEGWRYDMAYTRMSILLEDYYDDDKVSFVLSPNDSISQGVVDALLDDGYGSYTRPMPIITGQDCALESLHDIIEGKQAMSVFNDVNNMIDATVHMIEDVVEGETPEITDDQTYDNGVIVIPTYACAPVVVDVNNYEGVLIDSGYYYAEELDSYGSQVISYALGNTEVPELEVDTQVDYYLSSGEIVYYLFTPEVDGLYFIESLGYVDTYGELYLDDEFIDDNDDGGDESNFRIQGLLEAGQTYSIVVYGYSEESSGDISVIITQPFDMSRAVNIRADEPIDGYIYEGESVYYRFTPETSGVYGLGTSGDTDTYGTLYFEGQTLYTNDDYDDGNFYIETYMLGGETYDIIVEGYSESTTGDYVMLIEALYVNDGDTDMTLGLDETNYMYLTPENTNYFTFIPDESAIYFIQSHGDLDTVASIYQGSDMIAYNDDGGNSGNFMLEVNLDAGTEYVVEVSGYSDYTEGAYSVTVSLSENAMLTFENSETIYANQPEEYYLEMGALDVYSFTPDSSGTYTFTTEGILDTFGDLYLDGDLLDSNDDGGEDMNFMIEWNLTAGTTYMIVVSGYDESEEGFYDIIVED